MICGRADQEARNAAEAVKKRDHLGHLGHLDEAGKKTAEETAQNNAEGDPLVINDAPVNKGDDDGEKHSHSRDEVAFSRRDRRG